MNWSVAARTLAVSVFAGYAAHIISRGSYLVAALVGPVLYAPLIFISGAASFSELQTTFRLKWRTA
jgi:hypothetical protein